MNIFIFLGLGHCEVVDECDAGGPKSLPFQKHSSGGGGYFQRYILYSI